MGLAVWVNFETEPARAISHRACNSELRGKRRERMKFEMLQKLMNALTEVAGAVSRLRQLLPAGSDRLDDLSEEVTNLAGEFCEEHMLGNVGSPERTGVHNISPAADAFNSGVDESDHAAIRKAGLLPVSARPKAAKPKRAYVRKDKLGDPTGAKAAPVKSDPAFDVGANDKPTPLCIDCHAPYTKTSNVQKRCPGCAVLRKAAVQKVAQSRAKNPAATPDRLAAIKAIDKKLDTIPE